MTNSIKYFEEKCISKFEQLEDDFMKEPTKLAEYVFGLTEYSCAMGSYSIIRFYSWNYTETIV